MNQEQHYQGKETPSIHELSSTPENLSVSNEIQQPITETRSSLDQMMIDYQDYDRTQSPEFIQFQNTFLRNLDLYANRELQAAGFSPRDYRERSNVAYQKALAISAHYDEVAKTRGASIHSAALNTLGPVKPGRQSIPSIEEIIGFKEVALFDFFQRYKTHPKIKDMFNDQLVKDAAQSIAKIATFYYDQTGTSLQKYDQVLQSLDQETPEYKIIPRSQTKPQSQVTHNSQRYNEAANPNVTQEINQVNLLSGSEVQGLLPENDNQIPPTVQTANDVGSTQDWVGQVFNKPKQTAPRHLPMAGFEKASGPGRSIYRAETNWQNVGPHGHLPETQHPVQHNQPGWRMADFNYVKPKKETPPPKPPRQSLWKRFFG